MKKSLKNRNGMGLIGALALGLLSMGCSTPPVPDDSADAAYLSAMSSYEVCSQRNYPVSGNNYCNDVSPRYGNGMSYNQYSYGHPYGSGYKASGQAELASVVSDEWLKESWKSYLRTLDAETLKDLADQWNKLADE